FDDPDSVLPREAVLFEKRRHALGLVPFRWFHWLSPNTIRHEILVYGAGEAGNSSERKADAELAPQRTRNYGAARGQESRRVAECGLARNIAVEVVPVVGAVRQVERLGHELQLHTLAQVDVLRQAHIELEERISAKRIIPGDGAALENAVQAIKTVLRAGIIAGE